MPMVMPPFVGAIGMRQGLARFGSLNRLLMRLGVDGLSRSAVAIPEVKRRIRSLSLEDVRKLRQDVISHMNDGHVRVVLERFRRKHLKRSRAHA